ncbi:hypothetical protein G6F50_018157 [Rhizopus delemar]|uniref:Uncharacterized protein n=1 Tax=Rhizopus delemar TaxID=936053 RepID=A0A9P6XNL2_9FUNG|nr:hypothetical protein G6F50_018157 [Rhizopus delemar]
MPTPNPPVLTSTDNANGDHIPGGIRRASISATNRCMATDADGSGLPASAASTRRHCAINAFRPASEDGITASSRPANVQPPYCARLPSLPAQPAG